MKSPLFWKINIVDLSRWEKGKSVNWGNPLVNKWEKGDPCKKFKNRFRDDNMWSAGLNNITNKFSGWQHWLFQVWSPWVPPNNLAMPRPPQCSRRLRCSFCVKNSRRGLWAELRGESGAWAWDSKQQHQGWDQHHAAAFAVNAAVMRFPAAWEYKQQQQGWDQHDAAAFAVNAAVMRCEIEQYVRLSDEVERTRSCIKNKVGKQILQFWFWIAS